MLCSLSLILVQIVPMDKPGVREKVLREIEILYLCRNNRSEGRGEESSWNFHLPVWSVCLVQEHPPVDSAI